MITKAATMTKMFPPGPSVGALIVASLLAGCAADRPLRTPDVSDAVRAELATPVVRPSAVVPTKVSDALAEPAPKAMPAPAEPKLDLLVNDAQAREVFLAIVADTRYSMLMHPDVSGKLSVTLRGVTVTEALEAIRDVYGYDFKIEGRRIVVYAPTLQTRVFTINYPHALREGTSELRVSSGSSGNTSNTNNSSANSTGAAGGTNASSSGAGASTQQIGSRVTTSSRTDFWAELSDAVKGMLGGGAGRNVIVSPQAGIMAVRGMPDELRQVAQFLKAAQIAVERQVMLEAKIVEVELRDGFQSGIDWSALRNSGRYTGVMGSVGGGTANNVLVNGVTNNVPGFPSGNAATLADTLSLPGAGGGLFGLALATDGFQAVLGFLETRGDIQILSSPRIATMNNQKALLKVGTDEFFVTNVSGGTASTASTSTTSSTAPTLPTLTLTPFFSGIALDVTPQIDDGNNITLHVRPSVTNVTEKTKQIDLGTIGNYKLPLASSSVNESDTMVRIQDGNIVAIGGLMQMESNRTSSGMPGTSDVPFLSSILGHKLNSGRKKELVVLIKPTIIRSADDWETQTRRTKAALDDMDASRARVIRMDGSTYSVEPAGPAR
ncbi:MAG: secretin N-terminal domain-containing protein [Burkholderiaceae bacterium]|nr:secretin N-terminal domain-containing protein [Burkholderiaceae bacterium]